MGARAETIFENSPPEKTMLVRLASIIALVALVACSSPAQPNYADCLGQGALCPFIATILQHGDSATIDRCSGCLEANCFRQMKTSLLQSQNQEICAIGR